MTSTNSQYPLRPRGALELIDVSLKLYKKYFWPLFGVSALIWGVAFVQFMIIISLNDIYDGVPIAVALSAISLSAISFFFLMPFLYGAGSCCLIAALEARDVGFHDCMRFAAERYGRILMGMVIAAVSAFLAVLIYFLLLWVLSSPANYFFFVNLSIFILSPALFVGFSRLLLLPIITCLEEKQKGVQLSRRCFVISRNGARTLISLVFVNGVGVLAFWMILGLLTMMGPGLILAQNFMHGMTAYHARALLFAFVVITSFTFVGIIWSPFYLLILGTFYYDVRIRKEAFDLEYQLTHPDRI